MVMARESRKALLRSLQNLLATGEYSDLTVTCGTDTWKVHRSIVCARAEFFAGASRFPRTEAANNKIDLPDEEPAIVKLLMQFLYEGDYTPIIPDTAFTNTAPPHSAVIPGNKRHIFPHTCHLDSSGLQCQCIASICVHHACVSHYYTDRRIFCTGFICPICVPPPSVPVPTALPNMNSSDLLLHAKMYAIADRLIVTDLKALARAKFSHAVAIYKHDPVFPLAAEYIFSSTPDTDQGLRKEVSGVISKDPDLIKYAALKQLMMDYGELAVDVLEQTLEQVSKKRKCPS